MRVYRRTFDSAETAAIWRVAKDSIEELPTHLFVAFQAAGRDGDQMETIHVFDYADLRRIHNNSHQYPDHELEVDYREASRQFSQSYMMFQDAAGRFSDPDTGSKVSAGDFSALFPIYHFDVSERREPQERAGRVVVRWILRSPSWSAATPPATTSTASSSWSASSGWKPSTGRWTSSL
ncbi:MAG: hypothetical protein AB2556_23445 [Candidatus Thiodiazotropha sp.]